MKSFITLLSAVLMCSLFLIGCGTAATQSTQTSVHSPVDSLVLVTGITGRQGGGVATVLLEQGYQVRGLTRDTTSEASQAWSDRGVEMVKGDFTDYDSIKNAVDGADYIFVNIIQNIPDFVDAGKHTFDAAHEAGVKHIVFTSARLHELESGFPVRSPSMRDLELYLRESAYSYTIMRLPEMMENYLRDRDIQGFLGNGIVSYGLENSLGYTFNMYDMGRVTAGTFADTEKWSRRELNLASSALTDREIATLISKLSGRDIQYTTKSWDEATGQNAANFRFKEEHDLAYDMEELEREFPGLKTLEEFLVENNFGELMAAAISAPPAQERRGGGQGGGNRRGGERPAD